MGSARSSKLAFMIRKREVLAAIVAWGVSAACGGSLAPAEYPDVKLRGKTVSFELSDPRTDLDHPISEALVMDRGVSDTYLQPLPGEFEQKAAAKLESLIAGSGAELKVIAEVRRCDLTFTNEPHRGDFTRYDVVFGFRVTTASGALLDKGKGGAWREIPTEKASSAEMKRLLGATTTAAFDQYFSDEETLQTINENIERYLDAQK